MMRVMVEKKLEGAEGPIQLKIDLEIHSGEIIALSGPSGSGKTTLLRMILGLETPDLGFIQFGDEIWEDTAMGIHLPTQKRQVGMVFQDYALFPHLTIFQNLKFGLRTGGQIQRVHSLLDSIGLNGLAHRYPRHLSGGQQQRVALARALVFEPRLLLLDEPLAALDLVTREKLQRFLKAELERRNLTTILVSHQVDEMKRLAERVIWLDHGTVQAEGVWNEVLPQFYNP